MSDNQIIAELKRQLSNKNRQLDEQQRQLEKKDDEIDELERRINRRNRKIRSLAVAEKTYKIVVSRTVTERFPRLVAQSFGGHMPIPRLGFHNTMPSPSEIREWNRKTRSEKSTYWQDQPSINFIHAFRLAVSHPTYSATLTRTFVRIHRLTIHKNISLPAGEKFFQNALIDAMDTLAKNFPPLSQVIHSTGAPFTEENIMNAADVCTSYNPDDKKYWEFASKLIVGEVLGPNI